ncbi:MAG TPA: hypothetical protein DEF18_09885 [Muricauda sp.]|nr:hypothetical protein [Allomuricauda sp.]HBU78401.1 hypothetical protein [Allomuricauda sp.]
MIFLEQISHLCRTGTISRFVKYNSKLTEILQFECFFTKKKYLGPEFQAETQFWIQNSFGFSLELMVLNWTANQFLKNSLD